MSRIIEKPHNHLSDPTRDSWIRKRTSNKVDCATQFLEQLRIHPTHLNILGIIGVSLTSAALFLKERKSGNLTVKERVIFAALLGFFSLLDALDGSLARRIAQKEPEKIDFRKGQLYDVLADRGEETALYLTKALLALAKGDVLESAIEEAAAITSPWPSTTRAVVESQQRIVPELGKGPVGLIGTRAGRMGLNILTTIAPRRINSIPTRTIVDGLTVAGNLKTTVDRIKALHNSPSPELTETETEEAGLRSKVLIGFSLFSLATTIGLHQVFKPKINQ